MQRKVSQPCARLWLVLWLLPLLLLWILLRLWSLGSPRRRQCRALVNFAACGLLSLRPDLPRAAQEHVRQGPEARLVHGLAARQWSSVLEVKAQAITGLERVGGVEGDLPYAVLHLAFGMAPLDGLDDAAAHVSAIPCHLL